MSAWHRFVAFTSAREDGLSLALFRIATAAVCLWLSVAMLASDAPALIWIDGGYRAAPVPAEAHLARLLGGSTPRVVSLLLSLLGVAGALLLAGVLARAAALVALLCAHSLARLNPEVSGGEDHLLTNALFLLVFADSAKAVSPHKTRGDVLAWPRRLALLQILLMYFMTGAQKLVSVHWTPGGDFLALHHILQAPHWQRFSSLPLAELAPLTRALSLVTVAWELCAPLPWVIKRVDLRAPYVAIGLGFHLGIAAMMDVDFFSLIAVAYYPCLFRPEELRAFFAKARRAAGS
ncbi:MAG TPA: hypothetical protein VFS43_45275 [Polyangiaceae bacterium]|nr:hypothetical protein [Polyangiaceae bacterium]